MTDEDVFDKYCRNFNGICFITVLPKVGDPDSQSRQWYVDELQSASN